MPYASKSYPISSHNFFGNISLTRHSARFYGIFVDVIYGLFRKSKYPAAMQFLYEVQPFTQNKIEKKSFLGILNLIQFTMRKTKRKII